MPSRKPTGSRESPSRCSHCPASSRSCPAVVTTTASPVLSRPRYTASCPFPTAYTASLPRYPGRILSVRIRRAAIFISAQYTPSAHLRETAEGNVGGVGVNGAQLVERKGQVPVEIEGTVRHRVVSVKNQHGSLLSWSAVFSAGYRGAGLPRPVELRAGGTIRQPLLTARGKVALAGRPGNRLGLKRNLGRSDTHLGLQKP